MPHYWNAFAAKQWGDFLNWTLLQSDQREAEYVEFFCQILVFTPGMRGLHWPAAGAILPIRVENAVLAEEIAAVVRRVIIQQAVE